ncbi:MAG: hypothetical protein AB7P18_04715 [Candidatus Binatia bacterium]
MSRSFLIPSPSPSPEGLIITHIFATSANLETCKEIVWRTID